MSSSAIGSGFRRPATYEEAMVALSASMEVNAHLNDQIERLATEYDVAQREARDLEKRIRELCRELKEQRERADAAEREATAATERGAGSAAEGSPQPRTAAAAPGQPAAADAARTTAAAARASGYHETGAGRGSLDEAGAADEHPDDASSDAPLESLTDPAALEPAAPRAPPPVAPVVSPWLQPAGGGGDFGGAGGLSSGDSADLAPAPAVAPVPAASSPWLQATSTPDESASALSSASPAPRTAALSTTSSVPSRDESPSSGGSGWAVVPTPSQTPASAAATISSAAALSGRVDWPTLRARGESAGWLVDARDVSLGPMLGAGTFGQTHAGTWLGGNVAVKCVRLADDEAATVFAREVGALSAVRHPNIMALFGAVVEPPQRCWIVCERLDGGTLAEWLHGPRARYGAAGSPYVHPMPPAPPSQGHLLVAPRAARPSVPAAPAPGVPSRGAAAASSVASAASSWFGGALAAVSAAAAGASSASGGGAGGTVPAPAPASAPAPAPASAPAPAFAAPPPTAPSESAPTPRPAVSAPDRSSRARRLRAALDVARGMQALEQHDPPILHRDLKPSNIFLDDRGLAKVADLGLARALDAAALGGDLTGETGTYAYMSPENVRHELYTTASDVWSWGVLAVECLTRQRPYSHLHATPVQIAIEVSRGNLKPRIPADAPRDLQMLLNACFEADPDARPTFGLVVAHLEVIVAAMEAEEARARANAKWWDPATIASKLGVGM